MKKQNKMFGPEGPKINGLSPSELRLDLHTSLRHKVQNSSHLRDAATLSDVLIELDFRAVYVFFKKRTDFH